MSGIRPPKRLKLRPRWRGLPIPYIAIVRDDGTPDFRVTDEARRRSVIQNKQCQLCGQQLGHWFFFTGGLQAGAANAFFEPACHLDCLIYAMNVCPFIVGRIEHADIGKIQKEYGEPVGRPSTSKDGGSIIVKADDSFSVVRNPWWVIVKAIGWGYAQTPDKTLLLVPIGIKAVKVHPETMTAADWKVITQELMT
jgi:hypothetical protein